MTATRFLLKMHYAMQYIRVLLVPCTRIVPKQWWKPYWKRNSALCWHPSCCLWRFHFSRALLLLEHWMFRTWEQMWTDVWGLSSWPALQAVRCLSVLCGPSWGDEVPEHLLPLRLATISQKISNPQLIVVFQSGWKEIQAMHFVFDSSTKVGAADLEQKHLWSSCRNRTKTVFDLPFASKEGFAAWMSWDENFFQLWLRKRI